MFYKNLFFSIYSEVLCAKGKEALSKEQHFLIKFQQKFELFSSCQTQRLVSELWRQNQEMLGFRQQKITVDICNFLYLRDLVFLKFQPIEEEESSQIHDSPLCRHLKIWIQNCINLIYVVLQTRSLATLLDRDSRKMADLNIRSNLFDIRKSFVSLPCQI